MQRHSEDHPKPSLGLRLTWSILGSTAVGNSDGGPETMGHVRPTAFRPPSTSLPSAGVLAARPCVLLLLLTFSPFLLHVFVL